MSRRLALVIACAALLAATALFGASALPAAALPGTCPANEAIRTEQHPAEALPDCRAYEQVSPVYKQGSVLNNTFAATEDGSRMISSSYGAFAGVEEGRSNLNAPLPGMAYEFSRGSRGWSTRSIMPPASEYSGEGMFDLDPALTKGLWELGRRSQPASFTEFYLERLAPPAREFVPIGPATPESAGANTGAIGSEYEYNGASADLSHILFTIQEPAYRWPSDSTPDRHVRSLYELVGTGNTEPSLVGVRGGAESTELISQCGTQLGSTEPSPQRKGSMYNAISAAGDRIFFTAIGADDNLRPCSGEQPPFDELFVREETASGERQTVPISEPSLGHCSEAPSPACADAHFEGASRDGSVVFFTSTQKLLPGSSEESTNLYEDELSGSGPTLAQNLVLVSAGDPDPRVQGVARISEDGSHIYFVAQGVLSGAEENAYGDRAAAGQDNLYVFAAGHTSFIATLSPGDRGDWARSDARPVRASRDGRFLVFTAATDITHEGIAPGVRQVFRYDAESGELIRVSIGREGFNDDGRAPLYNAELDERSNYSYSDSPSLAGALTPGDGAVFFQSPTALTPQALDNRTDGYESRPVPNVYEYRDGNVYLLSDGRDTSTIRENPGLTLLGYTPSGNDLYFLTSDPLLAQDGDTQRDLYDVRVDGGFPAPPPAPACSGEGCQGPTSLSPPALLGSSAAVVGAGNPSQIHRPHKRHRKPRHLRRAAGHNHGGAR